ncbi:hypothetical protein MMC26_005954 [Xylographa opegraphella]|nr:hypothetical protein [Xylographa opegraphella]
MDSTGPPAAYHEKIQNSTTYEMALNDFVQSIPLTESAEVSASGSSRESSPLSDLARNPRPPGFLSLKEAGNYIPDEQSERATAVLSAALNEELAPYPYTHFNSFVPPALDSHRPVLALGSMTKLLSSSPSGRRKDTARASRFFPKPPAKKLSCIPFPALNATSFGLVQERLCHEPFRLLVAVMFLNKTRGKVALPVCYDLFARYPGPEDLANANFEELSGMIHELGLQNQRAERMIKLAQTWVKNPPKLGQRYRMLHYPGKEDGKDIAKGSDSIDDDDPRTAWEIAHLPGTGAYAMDSWRIFCRDELRGLPTGLQENLDPESIALEMQQEWTRVLPLDKELRSYLRWRWLRLGWTWDPVTGERTKLDKEACRELENGGISIEGDNTWALERASTSSGVSHSSVPEESDVGNTTDSEPETVDVKHRNETQCQTTERLSDMCGAGIGNRDFPEVQAAESTRGLQVQRIADLGTKEFASDSTDSAADAVTSALQWLGTPIPRDAFQDAHGSTS